MNKSTNRDGPTEDRRLWIGNLDPRASEYQLLKLLQKYGTIEKFDLIFHRTGPSAGQPRGYAFVTYKEKEKAGLAKTALNNLLVGQKPITVTWAHSINTDEIEKPKPEIFIPALAMSKEGKKADPISQIQAIEAKLELMEKKKEDELKINDTVATKPPVIIQYQYSQNQTNTNLKSRSSSRKSDRYTKPYTKHRR